jgi:predicted kinase
MPKLILLNGFAACGKTTLAKRYAREHPLALDVEGDEIIVMLGQWRQNIQEAVRCKLQLSESMVRTHLCSGYDVVLPFLLTDAKHAETYEYIARDVGADFFEIMLLVNKEEAMGRLLKRGRWGEEGLPALTEHDIPKIEKLYDDMMTATSERTHTINIYPKENEIDETYQMFLSAIRK